MEPETQERNTRPRPGKFWRRLIMMAALVVSILIAVLSGMVGYNLTRPLAPPATRPLAPLDADLPVVPHPVVRPGTDSAPSRPRTGSPLKAIASESVPTSTSLTRLLPEASQPSADLQTKARAINEEFVRLRGDFAQYLEFKKKRTDPDDPIVAEAQARARVYQSYDRIKKRLGEDFGAQWAGRFDELFLGMLMDSEDWTEALKFCVERRHDWDGGYYCARRMGKMEGGVMTAVLTGRHVYYKVNGMPKGNESLLSG